MINEMPGHGELDLRSNSLFPSSIERQTRRQLELLASHAVLTRTVEEVRGHLAGQVLETTGALSAMEATINAAVPDAANRTKFIVDAYVSGAASVLMRWRG